MKSKVGYAGKLFFGLVWQTLVYQLCHSTGFGYAGKLFFKREHNQLINHTVYRMVGGGTLLDGTQDAIDVEPLNPFCVMLVAEGLEGVELDDEIPLDQETWIVRVANAYHDGSGLSVAEKINHWPDAESAWKAYKNLPENNYTVQGCPKQGPFSYKSRHQTFITEYWEGQGAPYKSWYDAQNVHDLRTVWQDNGVLAECLSILEEMGDCSHGAMRQSEILVKNMLSHAKIIFGFVDACDQDLVNRFVISTLPCLIPLDADHKATYDQPADFAETGFDKFQQTLLSALQAPMKTATTIEKNVLGNMRAAILQRSGSSRRKKNTRASQEDNVPLQINVSAADGLQEREVQV
jgi:hypothetical protein